MELAGRAGGRSLLHLLAWSCALTLAACGPRAHIPARPLVVPGVLPPEDSGAILARQLAPLLYIQRDEMFPLSRVVAVLHPTRRVIAYHFLWRDDAFGSWVPFTVPTDQEILWVGYDTTNTPTDIWTYWHGSVLHADWRGKGQVIIDVQWGKHGSLPHNMRLTDLPVGKSMESFYLMTWWGLPDLWLGNMTRRGPWCFCHGWARYLEFTRPLFVGPRLDAIVRREDPGPVLEAVFGEKYSKKHPWP